MFLLAPASMAMRETGWPACPAGCSGHGNCSHIGVCSCERGWRGDACAEGVCPAHCARHGICVAGSGGASCACDAGYVGNDCTRRAPPPPPPFGSGVQTRRLGEVAPGRPVHHNFTLSSRLDGLPKGSRPLGALLPADAVSAFFLSPGDASAGARARLLHVRLGQELTLVEARDVDDEAFLTATQFPRAPGTLAHRAPSESAAGLTAALQPERSVRTATASAVDWGRGTAYVALTADGAGGPALLLLGACHRPSTPRRPAGHRALHTR
jgi:hypothetical protein